ncbi:MAG: glutamate--cysteine ligase [Halobacteriales archaeon]
METGTTEAFDRHGTVGVEEEFYVVDEAGRLTSGTDELVYESEPPEILEGRLDHELFKCVIETQTPTVDDISQARAALEATRDALVEHAAEHGYRIAAAGLPPTGNWRELEHAEKPRYRSQLERIQYPQHRNLTAGLHVHIGLDNADKAVWIANELRWALPLMLALSANSPFWNGFDTGLSSARAVVFENLPNTGMPTAFDDIDAYLEFERTMLETESINDRGELWFDVRPHTALGTVEIRAPDTQTEADRTWAFVEYAHALVMALGERYADGETGHRHRRELLDENKWRAARHGHDATLLDREFASAVELGELVDREADRLGVSGIRELYAEESGAARQRRLLDESGLDACCRSLLL